MDIDHPIRSPTPHVLSPTPPRTPSSSSVFAFPKPHLGIGQDTETWSSPAFLKRNRVSSTHSNLQYDPFQDNDSKEDKRRKRTRFGRESGQWRFADRTPSPEKYFYAPEPPVNEPKTVAFRKEVEISAVQSPESLASMQGRSHEAMHVEENQNVSPSGSSKSVGEETSALKEGDATNGKILRATPETYIELAPISPSSNVDKLEAELPYAHGSRSPIEEVVEHEEDLQRNAESFDEDEQMVLDLPENQETPTARRSRSASEASVVDINESPLAEDETAISAIPSPHPESLESAASPDELSVRGTSAEPGIFEADLYELETDEESDASDSDPFLTWIGGQEYAIDEDEDEVSSEAEYYQESAPESIEEVHTPVVNAKSLNEPSHFGLDGSAFSRRRLSPSPVPSNNKIIASINIESDHIDQIEYSNGGFSLSYTQAQNEGVEARAAENLSILARKDLERESFLGSVVAGRIGEPMIEHDPSEAEGTDTSNHAELVVTTSDQFQNQTFDARLMSHVGEGTGRAEGDPSYRDIAQELVQDPVNDIPFEPDHGSVVHFSADLHTGEKVASEKDKEGEEDEEDKEDVEALSEVDTEMQDQGKAMNASPTVPFRKSNVEIIDLESEDEEFENQNEETVQHEDENGHLLRHVHAEAGIVPILQEPDPMITQDTSRQTPSAGDEDGISGSSQAQAGDSPLEEPVPANVETAESQLIVIEGKEALTPGFATLQRLGTADDEQVATDVPTNVSDVNKEAVNGKDEPMNRKNKALHSDDDEFPDILDLFAASRNSLVADEKPTVMGHLSSQKTSNPQALKDEVQLQNRVSLKEEIIKEIGEDVREEPETLPETGTKLPNQLLTPNASQQTQLLSQESFLSLQYLPEDKNLPTPRLTQSISATSVDLATPKRRSFVERLKELRSLSSKSPQIRKSVDAASPWFAPKTSSKIIPNTDSDSVDSEEQTKEISDDKNHPKDRRSVKPVAKSSPQSPRLHKTFPATPPPTAPQQTQQPGFRTTLSYFAPLSTLNSHFDNSIDVLATIVASTSVSRAKTGPKDFHQSLYITDPSSASSKPPITTARIFRPHKTAFPNVQQGDAILLRNFRVQSQSKQLILLSTGSSAWAVFGMGEEVQMNGPPVEFAAEERGFVRGLWGWWKSFSNDERQFLDMAVPLKKVKGKEVQGRREKATPTPRKTRVAARHELRDEFMYSDGTAGEEDDNDSSQRDRSRRSATPTPRKTRVTVRHESRDGTTYIDETAEDQDANDKERQRARRTATPTPRKTRVTATHELRDGTTYSDGTAEQEDDNDEQGPERARRIATPAPKQTRIVERYEFRNGTTYVEYTDDDDKRKTTPTPKSTPKSTPNSKRTRGVLRHELRDGTSYTDGRLGDKNEVHELRDGTRYLDEDA